MNAAALLAEAERGVRPTAEPDARQGALLRRLFDVQVLESLVYLTQRAATGLGQPVDAQLERLERARDARTTGGKPLRGVATTLHTELAAALREEDGERVQALVRYLGEVELLTEEIRVGAPGSMDRDEEALLYATFGRENEREYKQRFDAMPPREGSQDRSVEAVARTLRVLADEDPEGAGEIDAMVSDLVIMQSQSINAGTSARAFGYILLRELGPEREWTTYLDCIVHEASHLYLYTLFLVDPILDETGTRTLRSPIRPGGRPPSAVLHAAFVLARTARIVRILRARDPFRDDIARMSTSYNAAENADSFEAKFLEAWETLREVSFTPFGEELLADCRRIAVGDG